jgi:hypothetical protein
VKTGDPNTAELTPWPSYEERAGDPLMYFGDRASTRPDWRTSRLRLLDAAFSNNAKN